MAAIKLDQAVAIAQQTLAQGRALNSKPLSVVVLDPGGHFVAVHREDGSGILRVDIAYGKAWGALGMGAGTRALVERAARLPHFVASLGSVSQGRIVPVPGGVLVLSADGELMGAVGVSGDTSDRDEECAVFGIRAAGLVADTGQAPA
jgi:uncharacterized protein GlcG (DUF336 family)